LASRRSTLECQGERGYVGESEQQAPMIHPTNDPSFLKERKASLSVGGSAIAILKLRSLQLRSLESDGERKPESTQSCA